MNLVLTVGVMVAIGIVAWILYDKKKENSKKETIIVQYS